MQVFGGTFLPTAALTCEGGNVTVSNTLPTPVVTNNGATVTFHAAQWFDLLALNSGTVQGSGDFVVTNRLVWVTGNVLGSAGVLRVETNAVLELVGGVTRTLGRSVANAGLVVADTVQTLNVQNTRIGNLAGGVMNLRGVNFIYTGGTVTVTNAGTLNVVGTNQVRFDVAVHKVAKTM